MLYAIDIYNRVLLSLPMFCLMVNAISIKKHRLIMKHIKELFRQLKSQHYKQFIFKILLNKRFYNYLYIKVWLNN